jgi:membrane protein
VPQGDVLQRIRALGRFLLKRTGNRGRQAETPADIPMLGWRDIVIRTWRSRRDDKLSVLAAGIAFFAFLALLPLVASAAMIYGLVTAPEQVLEDLRTAMVILPDAAQGPIAARAAEVINGDRGGPLALIGAVLLTLYAGARGTRALIASLNAVYGEDEEARFARRWGPALLLALGSAGLLALALIGIAAFGTIEPLLPGRSPAFWLTVRIASWLLVLLGFALGSAAPLGRIAVEGRARWRWILPGAAAATSLWLLNSFAFGLYIANFGRYDATYGSLAAVAILQLWLYLSAFIVLIGAKLNAEIERQTMKDTTVGPPRPRGRRQAQSADTVGEVPEISESPRGVGRPARTRS